MAPVTHRRRPDRLLVQQTPGPRAVARLVLGLAAKPHALGLAVALGIEERPIFDAAAGLALGKRAHVVVGGAPVGVGGLIKEAETLTRISATWLRG